VREKARGIKKILEGLKKQKCSVEDIPNNVVFIKQDTYTKYFNYESKINTYRYIE
jgi:hypothetical protein